MKRTLVFVLAMLLAFSGAAAAFARTRSRPPQAHAAAFYTLNIKQTKDGPILVNTAGSILYEFTKDHANHDTCAAIKGCTKVWLVMPTTGNDTAGPGVRASLISSIKVKGLSTRQITYAGHPLYIDALAPALATAIGTKSKGGYWYALNAKGHAVK